MKLPFLSRKFSSIREKLRFSFLITTVNILFIIAVFVWFYIRESSIQNVTDTLKLVNLRIEQAKNLEKDFYIEDAISVDFYETEQSAYVEEHQELLEVVESDLKRLKGSGEINDMNVTDDIDLLIQDINLFEHYFDSLVSVIKERGYKSYGIEGDLRRAIGRVTNAGYEMDEKTLLTIRRHEKDYILRKDSTTIRKIFTEVDKLIGTLPAVVDDPYGRAYIESALKDYKASFSKLIDKDLIIGNQNEAGLRGLLSELSTSIEHQVTQLDRQISDSADQTRTTTMYAIAILFLIFVILNFLLSDITTKDLSQPLERLSSSIHKVVEKDFDENVDVYHVERGDEIGMLSEDFDYMLDNVRAKTREVLTQKEQITQAYQNVQQLAKIGQDITSNLSINDIIDAVLANLNHLVRVSSFSLGVYDKKTDTITYREVFDDGTQREFTEHLNDKKKLGTYTFLRQENVIINHFSNETDPLKTFPADLVRFTQLPAVGVPLTSKGKRLGVFLAHPEPGKRFSEFEIDMIRNLAVYAVIALDNALIYENLEDTVQQRTEEVVAQKEQLEQSKTEIERAYQDVQLLSEIGQIVTSYLSVSVIIEQVYKHVNNLMDAMAFGIGIHDAENNELRFEGAIENGVKLESYSYSLDDTESLSVQCFNTKEEILVGEREQEKDKFTQEHIETSDGTYPNSMVYVPILVKDRVIGVLSVHSFERNAYTSNHINILRNLAIYAGIALENAETYEQIEAQKEEIQTKTKKLTASIKYAKRIQQAMLPDRQTIRQALPDSFILFKPRDVVSGDFFWFSELPDGRHVIAAVDCTGHGVPGALMSMIGNELLNEIVNLREITEPDKVLHEMHKGVRQDLKQRETQNRDGMDMAICVIDYQRKTLSFAGAKNPLVYIQNGDLHYLRGDKFPIGGKQMAQARAYTTHEVSFQVPTTFYIYSDGYQDQFGGEGGQRKFMAPRFRSLLHNIHFLPIDEQEEILDTTIRTWMKNNRQIDDILVLGFSP